MGWANEHINRLSLSSGPGVAFRFYNSSMEPIVMSGEEVTCYPWQVTNGIHVNDIVLCTVNNSQYLAVVKLVIEIMEANNPGPHYLIGDLKGREYGYTTLENIHGVMRNKLLGQAQEPLQKAFDATPEEMGEAAVEAAKPKRKYTKKTKS